MIKKIMRGDRGIALGLLCQLRMSLEKVYPPLDISVLNKGTNKQADAKPGTVIIPQKKAYDDHAHLHFSRLLKKQTRAQKADNLDDHQERFEETRRVQEEKARIEDHEEEDMHVKIRVRTSILTFLARHSKSQH